MTGEGWDGWRGGVGGLGIQREVRAANIDGNAVGMKAGDCDCIFMQMCTGPAKVCLAGNVGPHIAGFRLFSIFATVIMM